MTQDKRSAVVAGEDPFCEADLIDVYVCLLMDMDVDEKEANVKNRPYWGEVHGGVFLTVSQRNWIAALAFGLTALSGSVVAQEVRRPIDDAQRSGVIDQPDDPSETELSEDYGVSKKGNFCGPSYTLNCGYRSQPSAQARDPEAEQREKEDLEARQSTARSTEDMAFWTTVMALAATLSTLFSAAAVGLVWASLREARKSTDAAVASANAAREQVEEARKTDEDRLAAKLECVGGSYVTGDGITFSTDIYNGGLTDAVYYKLVIDTIIPRQDPDRFSSVGAFAEGHSLAKRKTARVRIQLFEPDYASRIKDFDQLCDGVSFHIKCSLTWKDEFGRDWSKTFYAFDKDAAVEQSGKFRIWNGGLGVRNDDPYKPEDYIDQRSKYKRKRPPP